MADLSKVSVGGTVYNLKDEEARNGLTSQVGNVDNLATEDKTNLVAAINELAAKVSSISDGNEVAY